MHDIFNEFILNLLVRGYVGIFQTLGNNLARQRERMLKTNFDDFGMLMQEVSLKLIDPRYPGFSFRLAGLKRNLNRSGLKLLITITLR
jgi:hypothetical protein